MKLVNCEGSQFYYNDNGDLHREDGPALEYPAKSFWYLNGVLYTYKDLESSGRIEEFKSKYPRFVESMILWEVHNS